MYNKYRRLGLLRDPTSKNLKRGVLLDEDELEPEDTINYDTIMSMTGNDKLYARELSDSRDTKRRRLDSDSSDSIDEITPNPIYNPSLDLSDHIVEGNLCPRCDGSLISIGTTGEICSNGCGYDLEDLYPDIEEYSLEVFGPGKI